MADSLGSLLHELQGMTGAGHAQHQKIPQDVQQLIRQAEQALAQGNFGQAAQDLQQAAQAAGKNTPLGQELNQAAQATQQYAQQQAPDPSQQGQGADGSHRGQNQNNQQCGQNQGGQQSGPSSQDINQLLSTALSLIGKGDSSDAKDLLRLALQQLSANYPSYATSNDMA